MQGISAHLPLYTLWGFKINQQNSLNPLLIELISSNYCAQETIVPGGAETIGFGSAWLRLGAMKCGSASATSQAMWLGSSQPLRHGLSILIILKVGDMYRKDTIER
ncbi:hypothetical protein PsorP6_012276 [Peronosclerospora sorghi]|uniref:Uncharacterized protein n=1 Tax=Peronosclerospora sorghi TaxID=230839 RepID=A0ACC0WJW4_9STRA|nr:hypothetical protein PsorP6_012276 [Peronosclerospora sorghi]